MLVLLILIIMLAFLGIILLVSGIVKKQKKLSIAGVVFILMGCVLGFWMMSESAISKRQLDKDKVSILQRFEVTIDEIKHPYDPCENSEFDGPVFKSVDSRMMRHFLYDDFAVIIDPSLGMNIVPLVHAEFPEFFFSISRAAYGIREMVIQSKPSDGNRWMIQLTGSSEMHSEVAFDFVIGEGKLDFTCPHYFKIRSKASVSASGKIYKYVDNRPEFVGELMHQEITDLTPDREYGVNLQGLSTKR